MAILDTEISSMVREYLKDNPPGDVSEYQIVSPSVVAERGDIKAARRCLNGALDYENDAAVSYLDTLVSTRIAELRKELEEWEDLSRIIDLLDTNEWHDHH